MNQCGLKAKHVACKKRGEQQFTFHKLTSDTLHVLAFRKLKHPYRIVPMGSTRAAFK